MKDDFLTNTSHELRTPLNGIIGIAESLLDGAKAVIATQKLFAIENAYSSANGNQAIEVGIGLNTGSLMLGIVGEKERAGAKYHFCQTPLGFAICIW